MSFARDNEILWSRRLAETSCPRVLNPRRLYFYIFLEVEKFENGGTSKLTYIILDSSICSIQSASVTCRGSSIGRACGSYIDNLKVAGSSPAFGFRIPSSIENSRPGFFLFFFSALLSGLIFIITLLPLEKLGGGQ